MKTMNFARRTFALILACCLLASTRFSAKAQTQDFEYFPLTGHNVQGDFLNFYHAATDQITLYGYPITEEFTKPEGIRIQYFQRARFEFHPELPTGQQVTLTNIGPALYISGTQLSVDSPFACRMYTETNYSVCFAFLEFFDKNGGVTQFGYPISPFEYHDGLIVQYFEKARMEWQPSQPEGQRVIITDLGRLYFDQQNEDIGLLQPAPPLNNAPSAITSIQVHVFAWKAVTLANDQQSIFIIAQDQNGSPVDGATCTANIRWPDGKVEAPQINTSSGVAVLPLTVANQPHGNLVYMNITCALGRETGTSNASFRIWY